ncbi:MAG TPA: hypothetical protein VHW96_23155 [Solirubrobacteraceae bacterium]|jgi:hypothetical protein|nr:hypothetical protein [Solirubrobacteraceae bacterium]
MLAGCFIDGRVSDVGRRVINDARQLPRTREQLVCDSLQIAQIVEMACQGTSRSWPVAIRAVSS